MVKGLYTAWTGMLNEQNRLDVVSNNLANANTAGYKKEGTTVHPFEQELAYKIKDKTTVDYADDLGYINAGVKIGENYVDYSQGSFKVTDNATDVALSGDGFFAIEFTDKDGTTSIKYTRDGQFKLTSDGYLVTQDGDYVLNRTGALNSTTGQTSYIQLDPTQEITIDQLGNIYQNDQLVAQLGVVDFADYDYVERYGENLFNLLDGGTVQASDAAVEQGTVEMSNVETVSEMVEMITIQRAYESNQKAIQTIDGMVEIAVNQVGKL
ncbi:MAG: flagellar basal-body rod protein FlgF [Eubacterium sp.]|nr:flagellar basal-body rod protein FlgF [Eubacterium sp.]